MKTKLIYQNPDPDTGLITRVVIKVGPICTATAFDEDRTKVLIETFPLRDLRQYVAGNCKVFGWTQTVRGATIVLHEEDRTQTLHAVESWLQKKPSIRQ